MGRTTVARAISLETINAGDGDGVIDLISPTFDMGGISMTINGEAGDDTIWAAEGDDELYGGDDDDILFGGEGDDILTGGSGADIFEFKSSNTAQTDSITDYTAEDTLKFYLQSGESELSSTNLSGGYLSWGIPDDRFWRHIHHKLRRSQHRLRLYLKCLLIFIF